MSCCIHIEAECGRFFLYDDTNSAINNFQYKLNGGSWVTCSTYYHDGTDDGVSYASASEWITLSSSHNYIDGWDCDTGSNESYASTHYIPKKPTGLTVSDFSEFQITVDWTAGANTDVTAVELRTSGGTLVSRQTNLTGESTTFAVGGFQDYYIQAWGTAVDPDGNTGDEYTDTAYTSQVAFTSRPQNWAWTTSIVKDGSMYGWTPTSGTPPFTVTAKLMPYTEWNNFCARVNQFRQFKGFSSYSFTAATSGGSATAAQANQAVTAINAMGFSLSSVSQGSNITAAFLNGLKNAINSI